MSLPVLLCPQLQKDGDEGRRVDDVAAQIQALIRQIAASPTAPGPQYTARVISSVRTLLVTLAPAVTLSALAFIITLSANNVAEHKSKKRRKEKRKIGCGKPTIHTATTAAGVRRAMVRGPW